VAVTVALVDGMVVVAVAVAVVESREVVVEGVSVALKDVLAIVFVGATIVVVANVERSAGLVAGEDVVNAALAVGAVEVDVVVVVVDLVAGSLVVL